MRVLLTGQPFSAQEALDMGLVSDIVADAEVRAEAITMATLIAGYSRSAVRRLKEVVLAGADLSLESGLLLERQALHLLFDTPGQKEGMRALLERRKPDFSGS
jgi:enoyl-CoA hydratase/carnithine racemase